MSIDSMAVAHERHISQEWAFDRACERERERMESEDDLWPLIEPKFGERIRELMCGSLWTKGYIALANDIDKHLDQIAADNVARRA